MELELDLDDNDPLVNLWGKFLHQAGYKKDVVDAATNPPHRLEVTYLDLVTFDRDEGSDLATEVMDNPDGALEALDEAVLRIDVPTGHSKRIDASVRSMPDWGRISLRRPKSKDLNRLVGVQGLVKKATSTRPQVIEAAWFCLRCNATIKYPQRNPWEGLEEPPECWEDHGGCGRKSTFRLIPEESVLRDAQLLKVQENPENIQGGPRPDDGLRSIVTGSFVDEVQPGDRVSLTSILRQNPQRKSKFLDLYLDVEHVQRETQRYQDIQPTDEELERILDVSEDPDLYGNLVQSIAPSLHGLTPEKEAIMLQLFGGVPRETSTGEHLRGDIHVLLVGDPGTGKSQLIRYCQNVTPRGVYTSGDGSTAAGLTAAAIKDEFNDGGWTFEAGALPMSDGGLCMIDEFDKMEPRDRASMHEAMEQQRISQAKAGQHMEMNTRCSILAACNPASGRFHENSDMVAEIDLPPSLVSRFDLIYILRDEFDEEDYRAKLRRVQQNRKREQPDEVQPAYEPEFLRRYIAYARNNCQPDTTPEADEHLREWQVEVRKNFLGREEATIPLTLRKQESLIRLAEASARARLSDEATVEDAKRATRIARGFIDRLNGDIDVVETGMSNREQKEHSRTLNVKKAVRSVARRHGGTAPRHKVKKHLEAKVNPQHVDAALEKLSERGEVLEVKADEFEVV